MSIPTPLSNVTSSSFSSILTSRLCLVGQQTAPLTEAPPAPSDESKSQILDAAKKDPEGQHVGGKDVSVAPADKVKTEKERTFGLT